MTALIAQLRLFCMLCLCLALATIQQPPVIAAQSTRPTALFLGDSYSVGEGAGTPTARFTTLTSNAMHWTEVNMAYGGSGYLMQCWTKTALHPNYLAVLKSVTVQPDVVIVSGGRNDQWNAKTAAAISAFFLTLHTKFPNAQLIATSPIWDARKQPPVKMGFIKSAVETAARQNGVTYIDLHEPLKGHSEYVARDQVHPNARGHAAIAAALISPLQALFSN